MSDDKPMTDLDTMKADMAVLAPFSAIAGELFALNFNNDDPVYSMNVAGKPLRLCAGDFFALRRLSARLAGADQPEVAGDGELRSCEECGGSGWQDTGGVYPWGEHIVVPCDCVSLSTSVPAGVVK